MAARSSSVPSAASYDKKDYTLSRKRLNKSGDEGQPYITPLRTSNGADSSSITKAFAVTSSYIRHKAATRPSAIPNSNVKA